MSLKTRLRQLEGRLDQDRPSALPIPWLVTVWVHSPKAPTFGTEPIRWGTIPGIPIVFERSLDESEDDFIARLAKRAPSIRTQFASLSEIQIYPESCKPG